jgi:hypothetical protein
MSYNSFPLIKDKFEKSDGIGMLEINVKFLTETLYTENDSFPYSENVFAEKIFCR